jgi:hypothetical protein
MVPQVDRVGERLEREAVLGEARDGECPGHGAERDHEVAPADRPFPDGRGARLDVDALDPAEQELCVPAHLAQRHDGVPGLERARRGLGQQRRVEHEVLRADDRRLASAEQPGDVRAGEAAAQDEHVAVF